MTTSFPSGLDNFTNPTASDTLDSPDHAAQHADVNDAVEALQSKVGVDSSAVTTSHDYKIAQLEGKSPTITLAGDATGSVTLTNLGSGTLTVAVADDSHNHSYLPLTGGTLTGHTTHGYNIATPANYWNGLQLEVQATSGTAGIGLHRSGYSHVGIYHDTTNVLKFNMNSGTVTLNHNTGTIWGSGNDGSGSGLDADLLDGVHASGFVSTSNNSSLNSDSRNTRGPTRLYRRDSNTDYSVQTYWTGSRWRLYGYLGDSNHADTHVGYADSAGNADTVDGYHAASFSLTSHTHSYLPTSGGTINGSLVVTSTIDANEYYGDNGAANDPSFTFQSDQDTGIYRYTTNQIGFTTGGGYRGRIASDGFHLASGDWFRSYGSAGWYNGTHGGGMYMTDSSYVRVYNSKGLQIQKASSANYNTAGLFLDANPCSLSFHPGGQAPQMRVGYNNNTIYCRNWADSGWCVVEADVIDRSSRKDKQDISDFKNSAMSLSSATDDTYSRSGLDIALALRPRHYRWDWQTHMRQLPTAERRARALRRLNNYRESKGLEPFENDELWHVCGRDCDGTADEPCWWVKDWQTGYFGFIAEEVGEVAPEATRFGEENDHTGIKTLAIAAIAVAAIQELSAKVESLEAQLEGES